MYTVKFILQPIVENCIHHGFEPREDTGTVKISGIRDGERISIIISDDGVGMDDKTLEDIRLRLSGGASGGHIGLKNVHDRIQLHFGESYGLRVDHAPGGGTRVVLDLPALDWEPRSFHAWDDMKYAFFEKE
jgi:two-component system sensor histidine kinase YesM